MSGVRERCDACKGKCCEDYDGDCTIEVYHMNDYRHDCKECKNGWKTDPDDLVDWKARAKAAEKKLADIQAQLIHVPHEFPKCWYPHECQSCHACEDESCLCYDDYPMDCGRSDINRHLAELRKLLDIPEKAKEPDGKA